MQQDLGSYSLDETQIVAKDIQGKTSLHTGTSSSNASHDINKRRSELFHIGVVAKHTKIETLFYLGSQVNLIS